MEKQHPHPAMSLPISLEIYQQLVSAAAASGFEQETWEIGAVAIREWMVRNNRPAHDYNGRKKSARSGRNPKLEQLINQPGD
jgi:hypothetical protein